jgi:hypothetical protein
MTIRKRTWKSPNGEMKDAWQVDYVDTQGIRRRQHFANKQDSDGAFIRHWSSLLSAAALGGALGVAFL